MKIPKLYLCLAVLSVTMVGCQSTPKPKGNERPLNVMRSPDGIQNIQWKIVQIIDKPARFFFNQPTLQLNYNIKRVQGNTGCNPLFGDYQINNQTNSLSIVAKAGYQSCDNALPQEADLMGALMDVRRYQIEGRQMKLQNARGKTLVLLQQP